jgi:hypothetical protein
MGPQAQVVNVKSKSAATVTTAPTTVTAANPNINPQRFGFLA